MVTLSVTDPDGDNVSLSITDAGDGDLFTLDGTTLSFTDAPDFENPADADGDNVYEVTVSASDGTDSASTTLEISVLNATEGRVVDGPVAGANVFIDLACNGIQDDNDPFSDNRC